MARGRCRIFIFFESMITIYDHQGFKIGFLRKSEIIKLKNEKK